MKENLCHVRQEANFYLERKFCVLGGKNSIKDEFISQKTNLCSTSRFCVVESKFYVIGDDFVPKEQILLRRRQLYVLEEYFLF